MLPEKFLRRMEKMLKEEYPDFLAGYEKENSHALRINTLRGNLEEIKEKLPFDLEPVEWNTKGFYYKKEQRPGLHPYHEAGVYYIQEASAMAPVIYLNPQPGEKVLDLCAAPGGKTTQIGAAMRGEGLLFANEIHPTRAKILSENVERMGIANAIVTNETPQKLCSHFENYFDAILVDAPCSGEGMFRKKEDACQEWSQENVKMCAERQDEILDCAAKMLRTGGRMVYSTCTFAAEENEGSISRFLERNPQFSITAVKKYEGMRGGVQAWLDKPCENIEQTIRLWPHCLRGEGHYLAVLKKEGHEWEERKIKYQKGLKEKDYKEYLDFVKEYLKEMPEGIYTAFGEQLYLLPQNTPSLEKIRVIRPGLHLGTLKKNRFEPSHALALALEPEKFQNVYALKSEDERVSAYLKGQTFAAEGKKGWQMITVDGFSLGWGKLTGNVMKNHYPKGLRR